MVFQDPGTSFNPTRRVGGQLAEVGRYHLGMSRAEARARAIDRLRAVHVPAPERRAGQYPHEFSGGMRQRAMIGMGLMGSPALIIADEPTTALDVTIQKQVLQLLQSIREADGVAILLISHDVAVVRQLCDRVLVMYAGRIVEDLPAAELDDRRPASLHAGARGGRPGHGERPATGPWPSSRAGRWSPSEVPPGCAYAARCPLADQRCLDEDPALVADARRSPGGLLARRRADGPRRHGSARGPGAWRRSRGRRRRGTGRHERAALRGGHASATGAGDTA